MPVKKPDGSIRLCVDYRKVNAVTRADPHYMPTLKEVVQAVGSSKVVSKLDLTKGYYQVKVHKKDREKTAFISPYGKFEFVRTPFGLLNAHAVFQRLIETVLVDCQDFSKAYIDDIIVYSSNWKEHLRHIEQVLQALQQAVLTAKLSKCAWGRKYMQFLGHMVSKNLLSQSSFEELL